MATKMSTLVKTCSNLRFLTVNKAASKTLQQQTRPVSQVTTSIPGPIPAEPHRKRFSITKVVACIALGTYVGQFVAKSFAAFMEETELFVPDDDDD